MNLRPRLNLADALRLYWRYLIGAAVFPIFFFVGGGAFSLPFFAFVPFFFAATLLAMWPYLAKDAPYSFWTFAGGVYMVAALIGAFLAAGIHALLRY